MPHGLTINELLNAAREQVERAAMPGAPSNQGYRAEGYLAGVKAAMECIVQPSSKVSEGAGQGVKSGLS